MQMAKNITLSSPLLRRSELLPVVKRSNRSLIVDALKVQAMAWRTAAEKANEKVPMMLDNDTRLDSVAAAGTKLIYNYTLVGYEAGEIDSEALIGNLRGRLISNACTGSLKASFLDRGASVVYSYRGKDEELIGEVNVDPADCAAR